MCSLVESSPLNMIITGAGPSIGGRCGAEVGGQSGSLVGNLNPADPGIAQLERLLRQFQDPPVGGHPVRVGLGEHPLGLGQVVRGPEVQLPGGAQVSGLFRLLRLPDQLIGERGPGPQEVAGAGVRTSGRRPPGSAGTPGRPRRSGRRCSVRRPRRGSRRSCRGRTRTRRLSFHGAAGCRGSDPVDCWVRRKRLCRTRGPGPRRRAPAAGRSPAITVLRMVPMPSTVISTTSPGCSGGGSSRAAAAPQFGQAAAVAAGAGAEHITGADLGAAGGVGHQLLERPAHVGQQVVDRSRNAVDRHRHLQREKAVVIAVGLELVGGDQPRAQGAGEVLALGRARG